MADLMGHVVYDLIYTNGEMFSVSNIFSTTEKLSHYTSYVFLSNMQEMYKVEEVRIAEVYVQGKTDIEIEEIINRLNVLEEYSKEFSREVGDTVWQGKQA